MLLIAMLASWATLCRLKRYLRVIRLLLEQSSGQRLRSWEVIQPVDMTVIPAVWARFLVFTSCRHIYGTTSIFVSF